MMADSGQPPPGMSFPQKISAENEEYVVDLEDNMHNVPDGYGLDDRGRCKRRKRCGQCGPCQVKENCMKCHFCVRKDVLKQTCIYRKCIYLRSKPKPYSRQHQSPPNSGRLSPREQSPAIKSPGGMVSPNLPFGEQGMVEPRPDNPFFPPQLPQPPQSQLGALQNNGYTSPVHMMDRSPSLSGSVGSSSVNMNMQLNMTPQLQNSASPLHKIGDQTSPLGLSQPGNSQSSAVAGISQITSCGNIPPVPSIPPVVPSLPSVLPPSVTTNSIPGIPPIPTMPGMNERAINDFRSPDQLSLHPHHPHPHFSAVPPVHPHPHMSHREANLFGDHSRVPHMNFSSTNHMDSFSRGPNDSSCMYHPSLPYSMPGHFQPSGPSFLSGAADPFRSNFLNSFPPGYSYPPDRYREGFGSLPFSRLGMSSTGPFPQYPGQSAGYGVGNSFSHQYSPYNSQHGCPKNGSCPPVSPSTDDVKVLQEGYKKFNIKKEKVHDTEFELQHSEMPVPNDDMSTWQEMSPGIDRLRLWNNVTPKQMERSNSVSSVSSRSSSLWEPWKSPFWQVGSRLDDVRSRTCSSRVSSDFECEVISIDDHQMNARIRSDGCNSIEIDIDGSSICGSEEKATSASTYASKLLTPESRNFSQVSDNPMLIKRSLFCDDQDRVKVQKEKGLGKKRTVPSGKTYFKEPVFVIQDLGDEGMLQLELPGHKVYIENVVLHEELLNKSSNTEELRKYISQKLVKDTVKEPIEITVK